MIDDKRQELSAPFFENLNGLRFVGAASVFLFHCVTLGREMWGDWMTAPLWSGMSKVLSKGHHGVGLFFVLSGFLITYLLLNEAKVKGKINALGFFMRRLLRIWPLYFALVIFGFFVFPALPFGIQTSNSLVYYGTFLSNFEEIWNGWRDPVSLLSVTWSVSIEEQFYLSWVLLIALLPAFRKGKYFHFYFLLLLVVSLIFRSFYFTYERMLYFHTLSVVSDLALGGYLSYWCFHRGLPDWFRTMVRWKIAGIYCIGILLILGSFTLFPEKLIIVERLSIGLFFAFVIAEQVHCTRSFFKADRIPGFAKLGEISYGLYMYHCVVIYFVQQVLISNGWTNSPIHWVCFVLVSALLTFGISWCSYRYLERPLLGLKRYFR